ncbi:MAG TPA: PDR/VanB family oxidoreductase [Duganella sp.]|uniref:PDR/VanB family oxidoreductase n=1 Tax=Duganella sp. TaxID=1904440 RepID=UPI002ED44E51
MTGMDAVITSIEERGDVRIFELRAADGSALPPYHAGAHIDVTLGNGQIRQYSLCCRQPSGDSYRIAVKRDPKSRGGSEWLHQEATQGHTLTLGEPRNAFSLRPSTGMHLLFAGGIGVTPLLSMAYALQRAGQPFHLAYFIRSEAENAFADETQTGPLAGHVVVFAGLQPQDNAARIEAIMQTAPASETTVYTCGPTPFMDAVIALGTTRFGASSVHKESFGAAPTAAGAASFTMRLVRSGRDIDVPAGSSALACLHAAGIAIDCSCEVGVCGTCRTVVLDGRPEHLDSVLSDAERQANACFMPCVSRSLTPVLYLDL